MQVTSQIDLAARTSAYMCHAGLSSMNSEKGFDNCVTQELSLSAIPSRVAITSIKITCLSCQDRQLGKKR